MKTTFQTQKFSGFAENNLFVAEFGDEIIVTACGEPEVWREYRVVVSASGSTSPFVKATQYLQDGYGGVERVREHLGECSIPARWPSVANDLARIGRAWVLFPALAGAERLAAEKILRQVPSLAVAASEEGYRDDLAV